MQPTQPGEHRGLRSPGSGSPPPVLALGAGITLLGVLRTFGRRHVPALALADDDSLVRHSRWYRRAPREAGGLGPRSGLADFLSATSIETAVLVPCSDERSREVAGLDTHLAGRFPASVSSPDVQDQLVDKARFARLLERSGTPHPRTVIVDSPADLERVDAELLERAFLKPRDSQAFFRRFRVKAFLARDVADLRARMDQVAAAGLAVILQEYVPGPASNHYFVDGFLDREGRVRARFVRQRLRMYPPDFGNSSYMRSVPPGEARGAVEAIESLLGGMGFRGVYSAEFKKDERDGVFRLLEVNARPWWYVEFAARCGVDIVWMSYLDALGRPVPERFDYEVGRTLAFPRYDLHACLDGIRAGEVTAGQCLRSWVGSDRPIFVWDDPMPAVREGLRNAGASLGRRLPGRRRRRLQP